MYEEYLFERHAITINKKLFETAFVQLCIECGHESLAAEVSGSVVELTDKKAVIAMACTECECDHFVDYERVKSEAIELVIDGERFTAESVQTCFHCDHEYMTEEVRDDIRDDAFHDEYMTVPVACPTCYEDNFISLEVSVTEVFESVARQLDGLIVSSVQTADDAWRLELEISDESKLVRAVFCSLKIEMPAGFGLTGLYKERGVPVAIIRRR